MKKSVLVFGAGLNQLHLIQAVNKCGYNSIAIDPDPNAIAKNEATNFVVVAPKDYEKTKEVAEKYNVDGIVTAQMENPLILMARLAKEMGYIFPSQEAIECSRNKFLMKQKFIEHGVPCAKGFISHDLGEIEKMDITFPAILKPADAHSSRGVFKVESKQELRKYYNITSDWSSDNSVIIEEFMTGQEYSVEVIVYDEIVTVVAFTEKTITDYPMAVELMHIQPSELSQEVKDKACKIIQKAIKALGIDNSGCHVEIFIDKDDIRIVEIGARLGGDFISSYLTLDSCGVDMDKAIVEVCLGIEPDLVPKFDRYSIVKYIVLPEGKVINKLPSEDELSFEWLRMVHFFSKVGDKVGEITNSAMRTGFYILSATTKEELLERIDILDNQLESLIELGE